MSLAFLWCLPWRFHVLSAVPRLATRLDLPVLRSGIPDPDLPYLELSLSPKLLYGRMTAPLEVLALQEPDLSQCLGLMTSSDVEVLLYVLPAFGVFQPVL